MHPASFFHPLFPPPPFSFLPLTLSAMWLIEPDRFWARRRQPLCSCRRGWEAFWRRSASSADDDGSSRSSRFLPPAGAACRSAGISLHVPTSSGGLNSLPRFDKEGRNPSHVRRLRFAESISAWVCCYRSPKMHQIDIWRSAPRGIQEGS